jgi:hypothetical protein
MVLSLQESKQLRERLVRNFFGHEVSAGQSFSSDIHRVFTPDPGNNDERPAACVLVVTAADAAKVLLRKSRRS